MEAQLVLIEKEDKAQNKVLGCSGVMLNQKYIIITGNILSDIDKQNTLEKLQPGKLYTNLFSNYGSRLNAVWINNGLYIVKKARVFATFVSGNIKKSSKHIFRNWAINSIDNNRNLHKTLSAFFILSFEKNDNTEDITKVFTEWWRLMVDFDFVKSQTLYARSVPFGNRDFIDSYSKGIVSNIFGNNSCFILSDCPTTPGSEGSPIYISSTQNKDMNLPAGLILSSVSWWKGEWVGLTLIVDIKSLLLELIDVPITTRNVKLTDVNTKLIATTEYSLVQIYCGNNWGTAILLNKKKGIFITNSHVIVDKRIRIFYKDTNWNADLIYSTPKSSALDLALIKSETKILKELSLRQVNIARKKYNIGETVYSAGFSLFTKNCQPTPNLTEGCISLSNPFMLKTTCSIHAGASGGAILDKEGLLLGIIVSNIKLNENHVVYPRMNVSVPILLVADIIFKYIENTDSSVLNHLSAISSEAEIMWKNLESKL